MRFLIKLILIILLVWAALSVFGGDGSAGLASLPAGCQITHNKATAESWGNHYAMIHNGRHAWTNCRGVARGERSYSTFGDGGDASQCTMDYSTQPAQLVCTRD